MKRTVIHLLTIFVLLALHSCAVVPHTQRKALILISPQQEMAMAEQAY